MTTLVLEKEPIAANVRVTDDRLIVDLVDGRSLEIPLDWYPRLSHGTAVERQQWHLLGDGYAIEWPELDEHIGVEGLLAGRRSGESQKSFDRWLATRTLVVAFRIHHSAFRIPWAATPTETAASPTRRQAAPCAGLTSTRPGSTSVQRAKTRGQRGWKRQPCRMWIGLGGSPWRMSRSRRWRGLGTGITESRACVYGLLARRSGLGRIDAHRPLRLGRASFRGARAPACHIQKGLARKVAER